MSATDPLRRSAKVRESVPARFRHVSAGAAIGLSCLCCAAAPPAPTPHIQSGAQSDPRPRSGSESARTAQPVITEQDIDAARQRYGPAFEAARKRSDAAGQALPAVRVDALPQPAAAPPIDLARVAEGYEAVAAPTPGGLPGPALLVFVSLSMPRPTLERLFEQGDRARAVILLRGLAGGSLRDTATQVQSLIGQRRLDVQIDPQLFDRYAVARVPTFVLVPGGRPAPCASGSCPPAGEHLRVAGDVSLDYALEHMQRSVPAFADSAGPFLGRLRPAAK